MSTQVSEFQEFYYFEDLETFGADPVELKDDYWHIDIEDGRWVVMGTDAERFEIYHISDFMRFGGMWGMERPDGVPEMYHGYKQDGYCGLVLIAVSDDGETYKTAYYS